MNRDRNEQGYRSRDFMDCRECHKLGEHTRKAGCIIATERAAAANLVGSGDPVGSDNTLSCKTPGPLSEADREWLHDMRAKYGTAAMRVEFHRWLVLLDEEDEEYEDEPLPGDDPEYDSNYYSPDQDRGRKLGWTEDEFRAYIAAALDDDDEYEDEDMHRGER